MKKIPLLLFCVCFMFAIIGCSSSEVIEQEIIEKPVVTPAQATENEPEVQPNVEFSQNTDAHSSSHGFADITTYDFEEYNENFGTDGNSKENVSSEKTITGNRLIPYNEEEFSFLEYISRPDLCHFTYRFKIVDSGNENARLEISYDYGTYWNKLESSMTSKIGKTVEEITINSQLIDKILYSQKEDSYIGMYLTYIDDEPVLIRFFHTPKEDALEILEGCEFVAPEEITK